MESITYHGISMGGKLYSLRMAKRMSQEQLAAVLGISSAAVSKWERDLSKPSIELLWALADLFACSIAAALAGASGEVVQAFLSNLSERMLYFIHEDMIQWSGTEEDILEAQRKVQENGHFINVSDK